MDIREDVSLKNYSTMRFGGNAKYLCSVSSEKELLEALYFADEKNLKTKVIGGGSNIIWSDFGFDGLVIVNDIEHMQIDGQIVAVGAGMVWDEVVSKTVEKGLSGIEFLSLIPGKSGAVPVQNVGAYGKEISEVLVSLKAYDTGQKEFVTLDNKQCEFGYRSSIFNKEQAGRYIITELTLELSNRPASPPFYNSLQKYIIENSVEDFGPLSIRNAVIKVRQSKLPDPKTVANSGSFFANPIIDSGKLEQLQAKFPDIPNWQIGDKFKVSAAWLVDQAGFKDFQDQETGMATWPNHPLIIINRNAKSTKDLIQFVAKIKNAIEEKFQITLQTEPELIVG